MTDNTLFRSKRLGVIGAGNMGRALLKGILEARLVSGHRITVADADEKQLRSLKNEMTVITDTDNWRVVRDADVVLLCVKPQQMDEVLAAIADEASAKKLFISIAAGVTTRRIEKALGKVPVVRVMPNTPALIGQGASGLCPGRYARPVDMRRAKAVFDVVGTAIVVKEKDMDAVTGLSGSGPAYVFTFIEGLIEAGQKAGLKAADAEALAMQTVQGAAALAARSKEGPSQLRNRVTSKGGTTLAGLKAMDIGRFKKIMHKTVAAATARSKELGK